MLMCNNKEIDISKAGNYNKFVKEKFKELDNLKLWPMRFQYPGNSKMVHNLKGNFGGRIRNVQEKFNGHNAPLYRSIMRDGISENWRYYETERVDTKGNKTYYPRKILQTKIERLDGRNTFTRDQRELAFYLIYISGYCEEIDDLTDQKTDKKSYMSIIDKRREARKIAEKNLEAAQVNMALYNEDILSEDKLRTLAAFYQVDHAFDVEELNILRNAISNKVLKSNDKLAISKFNESLNIGEDVQLLALIKRARDKGLIKSNKTGWYYIDAEGKTGDLITYNNPRDTHNNSIKNFLKADKDALKFLENALEEYLKEFEAA